MRVNNRKWISEISLVLFMVIATIGIGHAEVPNSYIEGFYTYTLNADGNATITAYSGDEEDIVVPSTLGGHKVIKINAGETASTSVFMKNNVVKTITIPDGVISLEDAAFADDPNLVTVNLPSSIQNFGSSMFEDDSKLENIYVSNDTLSVYDIDGVLYSVSELGTVLQAYPQNKAGTSYNISNNTHSIMTGAFSDNNNLKKIVVPSGVDMIYMNAFSRIKNTISIYINSTEIEFDPNCFMNLAQGSKIYVKNAAIASKLSGCYSVDTTTVVDLSSLSDEEIKDVTTPATSIELKNSTDEHLIVNYDVKINLNNRYSVAPADTTDAVTWTSCVLDPVTGEPTGTEQPVDSAKAYGPGKPQYVRLTATTDSGKSIAMYVRYQKDLKECSLSVSASDLEYTGAAQKPKMDVYYYVGNDKTLLTEGVDYKVDLIKNTDAGTSSYTVNGINNYKGSKDGTFEIKRKSIERDKDGNNYLDSITLDCDSFTYDGTAKTPTATVKIEGRTLIKDKDYTVSYSNNIGTGFYPLENGWVSIEGAGNYVGSASKAFDIKLPDQTEQPETPERISIENAEITLPQSSYVSPGMGQAVSPEPRVVVNGVLLLKDVDYFVLYSNNYIAGTATLTVYGKEKYTGSKSMNYTITQAPEGNGGTSGGGNNGGGTSGGGNNNGGGSTGGTTGGGTTGGGTSTPDTNSPADKITNVLDIYTKYYGDKAFTLKAKGNGKISYSSNNKNVVTIDKSKGKVTIKGTGSTVITVKSGDASKKVTINVAPKKNAISKLSAGKKYFKVSYKKDTKATGYQICFSTSKSFKGSKTDTVKSSKTTSKIIKKLKSGKTYYVRVRAYKSAKVNGKNTQLCSKWSNVKTARVK